MKKVGNRVGNLTKEKPPYKLQVNSVSVKNIFGKIGSEEMGK